MKVMRNVLTRPNVTTSIWAQNGIRVNAISALHANGNCERAGRTDRGEACAPVAIT